MADASRVRVMCRLRPNSVKEGDATCVSLTNEDDGQIVSLRDPLGRYEHQRFLFDEAFGSTATQEDVFSSVKPCVRSVLTGVNATVFAYGMTGSGKTHTILGSESNPGIIPRAVRELISAVHGTSGNLLQAAYVEIYNNRVFDLFSLGGKELPVRDDANGNVVIQNLKFVEVAEEGKFLDIFHQANRSRATGATAMNARSSRSHAILMFRVRVRDTKNPQSFYSAKLHLIDLAGNEDNRRTNNSGIRMTESNCINTSLFALGKVINALHSGSQRIPYRDSKLTRILQDSLGGGANTVMLTCVAPCPEFFMDTYHTLNYANKARLVVNIPVQNVEEDEVEEKMTREQQLAEWKAKQAKKRKSVSDTAVSSKVRAVTSNQSAANDKENIGNTNQAPLITPSLRQSKLLKPESLSRLESLERKMQQDLNVPATAAAAAAPDVAKKTTTDMSVATELVRKAKTFELKGNREEALEKYCQAAALLPEHPDLNAKIHALEEDIRNNPTPVAAAAESKPKAKKASKKKSSVEKEKSFDSISSEEVENCCEKVRLELSEAMKLLIEQNVLTVLNSGPMKSLLKLKGIGEKRAQSILEYRETVEQPIAFHNIADLSKIGMAKKLIDRFLSDNAVSAVQMQW